ncbi:MAG TPA: hypothetical protein H9991_02920 [Candidatus Mailhella excrementigallinarum]|nr:MAG: hypothetical protein DBY37_04150 [Desulfovibrionaceae bacterium]HIV65191.1 hypothetical protein [Candidatus Mailhella excrementigallinarum]
MPIHDVMHIVFWCSCLAVLMTGCLMLLGDAPRHISAWHRKATVLFLIIGGIYVVSHGHLKLPKLGPHVLVVVLLVIAVIFLLIFRAIQRDGKNPAEKERGDGQM